MQLVMFKQQTIKWYIWASGVCWLC